MALSDACNSDLGQKNTQIYVFKTIAGESFKDLCEKPYSAGAPCGDDNMGKFYRALKKFFIFLKSIKKYADKYINGTINAIQNLQGEIQETISVLVAATKTLIQRIREWILKKIKNGIEDILNMILPPLMKQIKSGLIKQIIDQIFCKFEDIIAGLFKFVGEFLYSLVGQVINTPICAVENFINAFLNKLANDIDQALGPIFDQINDVLGGVSKITGSVFQAIDFILGFEGFLCAGPDCPDVKEFKASPWGGPQNSKTDNWYNFKFSESAGKTLNGWMDDFFGPSDGEYISPGGCYSGVFECGIPQIEIFGGGGSGAVAAAVVNSIGQIIGANLFYGGKGYTSTPFVSIVDPGNCGKNASAYAVMTPKDANGKSSVKKIVITSPGSDYSDTFTGGAPVINSFAGSPNPIELNNTISLSWDVTNSSNISLNIPGYTNLSPNQTVYLPITSNDVSFSAGATETIKTYKLTATKNNTLSSPQVVTQNLDITVVSSAQTNTTQSTNTNSPVINAFTANPQVLSPGEIVTLSWETSNATKVSLDVPGYSSIPLDGSISLVIPSDIKFPSNTNTITQYYTLTAENSYAPKGNETATNKISIQITNSNIVKKGSGPGGGGVPSGSGGAAVDGGAAGGGGGAAGGGGGGAAGSGGGGTAASGAGGGGNNATSQNYVPQIDDILIIDTGVGYKNTDTVSIIGGNNGADISLELTPTGQIIGFKINSPGYGFISIPEIVINSDTGVGAKFRSILKFIPLNKFLAQEELESINPEKLVQVIDCVSR